MWGRLKGSCGEENCCFSFQNGANRRRRFFSVCVPLLCSVNLSLIMSAERSRKEDDVEYFQLIK